jgi:hypothetical protein
MIETILSCFPSQHLQYQPDNFTDLYNSMQQNWTRCETVWDMFGTLMREAATYPFRQDNKASADLIETYRWVISDKVSISQTKSVIQFAPTENLPTSRQRSKQPIFRTLAEVMCVESSSLSISMIAKN